MRAQTGIGASALVGLVMLFGGAPTALAQVMLEGRVLDDVSGLPLAGSQVVLLNRSARFVASTVADEVGHFRFERKRHGVYRVRASAVGYKQAMSPPMWMTLDSDSTVVEVRLAPNVVLLAPLEIIALKPTKPSPVLENMEHRQRLGFGVHITRSEIVERQPVNVSDVLLEVPGIYADRIGTGASGRQLYMARALPATGGGACPMQVFLDGRRATRDREILIDDLVNPRDVEAIEIFRGLATIPPEFLTPDARCGVVAIWTRRALAPRP